jgi:hypothetical protein
VERDPRRTSSAKHVGRGHDRGRHPARIGRSVVVPLDGEVRVRRGLADVEQGVDGVQRPEDTLSPVGSTYASGLFST